MLASSYVYFRNRNGVPRDNAHLTRALVAHGFFAGDPGSGPCGSGFGGGGSSTEAI